MRGIGSRPVSAIRPAKTDTTEGAPPLRASAVSRTCSSVQIAVTLSFTPAARLYASRSGNALVVAGLTMLGDAYSHANHYAIPYLEAAVTGAVSGLLAYAGSYLFEDRARRLRAVWALVAR